MPARQLEQMQQRDALEQQRLRELQVARDAYASECQAREAEVARGQRDDWTPSSLALRPASTPRSRSTSGLFSATPSIRNALAVEHDYEFDPEYAELDAGGADLAPRRSSGARRRTGTSRPRTRSQRPRWRRSTSRPGTQTSSTRSPFERCTRSSKPTALGTSRRSRSQSAPKPRTRPPAESDGSFSSAWPQSATPSWRLTCITSCPQPRLSTSARRCRRTHSNSSGIDETPGVRGG